MLRGMGFDSNTSIYIASGKIYHAERYLAPLMKMFPYLYTKESLATSDELAPFMVKILASWKTRTITNVLIHSMKLDGFKVLQFMFYFDFFLIVTCRLEHINLILVYLSCLKLCWSNTFFSHTININNFFVLAVVKYINIYTTHLRS